MRHEGPFFLFKSEKKTDEGQLKQMREAPRIYSFFFFWPKFNCINVRNKGVLITWTC